MEEVKKVIHAFNSNSIREIVNFINIKQLQKEDLFTLIKSAEGYILLYYK